MELNIDTGTTMDCFRRTLSLALCGAVKVSAGAGPLRGDRVPAMAPLQVIDGLRSAVPAAVRSDARVPAERAAA